MKNNKKNGAFDLFTCVIFSDCQFLRYFFEKYVGRHEIFKILYIYKIEIRNSETYLPEASVSSTMTLHLLIYVIRFWKSTHISMINNSATHLQSYTNSAIAEYSVPISPVTPRDLRRLRIERRRLHNEHRYHRIEWRVLHDVSQCFKSVSWCFICGSWCFTCGSWCFTSGSWCITMFYMCFMMFYYV